MSTASRSSRTKDGTSTSGWHTNEKSRIGWTRANLHVETAGGTEFHVSTRRVGLAGRDLCAEMHKGIAGGWKTLAPTDGVRSERPAKPKEKRTDAFRDPVILGRGSDGGR